MASRKSRAVARLLENCLALRIAEAEPAATKTNTPTSNQPAILESFTMFFRKAGVAPALWASEVLHFRSINSMIIENQSGAVNEQYRDGTSLHGLPVVISRAVPSEYAARAK